MQQHEQPLQRRRKWAAAAAAITTLCVQYTVFLMSQPQEKERAHWNELEVSNLIDYLHKQRSTVGEGGNFKMTTYNSAAESISPHLSDGPRKTGQMCKTKWISIKHLYTAIEKYRGQSGFHWDNDRGASIEGEAAAAVWTTYITQKSNSVLRPYRNRGWEHYDKVHEIIPSVGARGTHAFHPSLSNTPSLVVDGEDDQDESIRAGKESGSASASNVSAAVASNATGLGMRSHNPSSHSSASRGKRKYSALDDTSPRASDSVSKRQSKRTNSKNSTHAVTSSANFSTKVTHATAITNMQGSINRLTDVFEKSIVTSEAATRKDQAVERLQEVEKDLSMDEQLTLVRQFDKNEGLGGTYLSLKSEDLRKAWIRKRLEEPDEGAM